MRSVSVFYHGMFNFTDFELPEHVILKNEIKADSEFLSGLKSSMSDNDMICDSIILYNQLYKNGDLVVLGIEDCDNLTVGLIKTIMIKASKVYFVAQSYKATRNWLQYFECKKPKDDICQFVETDKILDFKPLIMRGTIDQFLFTLHHYISYDYA